MTDDPVLRCGPAMLPPATADADAQLQLPWKVDISYGGRVQVLDAAGNRVAIFYGAGGGAAERAHAAVAAVNISTTEALPASGTTT